MIYFLQPWALLAVAGWFLVLTWVYRRQQVSLDWIETHVGVRFRQTFTRYTKRGIRGHFIFLAVAGALLAVSAAGPYRLARVEREVETHTVLLALDGSLSMGATDAGVDPETGEPFESRFAAARSIARTIVASLPEGSEFGVYSFSGVSVVHSPPTRDRTAIGLLLDTLSYHVELTKTGTRYSSLFDALWGSIDPEVAAGYQVVLISDGELPQTDQYDDDLAVFAELDIPVHTMGVGSLEGEARVIFHPDDLRDKVDEKRVARKYTTTRVDRFLRKISKVTGGSWQVFEKPGAVDRLVAAIESSESVAVKRDVTGRDDLSHFPMLAFLVLFLVESLIFARRSPDPNRVMIASLVLAVTITSIGCEPRIWKAHRTNETGIHELQSGRAQSAEPWFKKSYSLAFREHIPLFNLASAALDQDDPARAHEIYERVLVTKPTMAKAYFNDGHALFLWAEKEIIAGMETCEFDRAKELLKHAASRFERAAQLDSLFGSLAGPAKKNRDFATLQIAQLEKFEEQCEAPPPPPAGGGGGGDGGGGGGGGAEDPSSDPPPPPPPAGESSSGEPPPLSEAERDEIEGAIERIQQEAAGAGGFRQSEEQQMSPEMLENASGLELWW